MRALITILLVGAVGYGGYRLFRGRKSAAPPPRRNETVSIVDKAKQEIAARAASRRALNMDKDIALAVEEGRPTNVALGSGAQKAPPTFHGRIIPIE